MADGGEMKNDAFYAEMIQMMRAQGRKDNPVTLQLGVMQSATSVKIDDLVLNAEDLYIAAHLMDGYVYPLKTAYVYDKTFGLNGTATSRTDKAIRAEGLKKGDLVAVQKLNNNNKYVILERVVAV
jgi:hypothetical protein